VLNKKTIIGLGWCNVCQEKEETIMHLIMAHPYTKEACKEVERMIGLINV